jgi:hypothetical protein
MYYARVCGTGVIDVLDSGVLSGGIRVLTFDFTDPDTGEYYYPYYYWIALCNADEVIWAESVEFRE